MSHGTPEPLLARVGGWLFRRRTAIPVPIVLLLLVLPAGEIPAARALTAAGASLVIFGELVRLWGVRHIGAISRTRADRLGPLVVSGPFRLVRNPLYVGNLLIWIGFTLSAHLLWLAPLVAAVIGFEYHAIVRWEEQLLLARRGQAYRDYLDQVPRWIPRPIRRARRAPVPAAYSWAQTLYSERGTLVAILAGSLLLMLKGHLM